MRGLVGVVITMSLAGILSMSAGKASAESAEYVTFDFALQVIGPGLAVGTFELLDSDGVVLDSGEAMETFEFVEDQTGVVIVAMGEKILYGEKGTIKISFTGIIMPDETGLLVAKSPWRLLSGTGEYEGLRGGGLGEATLNPGTGELNASYPGMVQDLPD